MANSIDNKYKNLEDPFASPEISKKVKKVVNEEENKKNAKIMDRINKGRKKRSSQSVDNAKYQKSNEIQKMADKLGERLFKEKNINQ